jgi:hypothetical protein
MGGSLKSAGASSRVFRVSYLHKFCIAHGDVNDEGEGVDGQREAKELDGVARDREKVDCTAQSRPTGGQPVANRASEFFSVILASSGKEKEFLGTTARKLTPHNPEERPSMLQVAASPLDVANVAVEGKAPRFSARHGAGSRLRKTRYARG